MMPPNIPSTVPSTPATSPPFTPTIEAIADDGIGLVHADYDLHPLAVRSLDHYVAKGEDDERFHVR